MSVNANTEWINNLDDMICRNINTDIIAGFENKRNALSGKIKDLPDDVFDQCENMDNGEKLINTVTEAEEVFLREFSEI
jgi:hypothetical protein